ncbi:MAG: hypothetical protein JWO42_1244 [Chloroflexi bacterium]|nr:hypothetical protein [Chloroflexota bacterium]
MRPGLRLNYVEAGPDVVSGQGPSGWKIARNGHQIVAYDRSNFRLPSSHGPATQPRGAAGPWSSTQRGSLRTAFGIVQVATLQ